MPYGPSLIRPLVHEPDSTPFADGSGCRARPCYQSRVEVHLPCPPLGEWLPERLSGLTTAAWAPSRAPRRLRRVLARWPSIDGEGQDPREQLRDLDALLFGIRLERPAPPDPYLASLRPGALIIELALPRMRIGRALLGLSPRPLARAHAGQSRVLAWLARGYHELEQWESVDPHGVIVTLARVRAADQY